MISRSIACALSLILAAAGTAAAATPTPEEVADRVLAALGGDAFSVIGVLELAVDEEQTRNDGTTSRNRYTAWVDTANLQNARLQLPGEVVVARGGGEGWSTTKGVLDDRPQTPGMAARTLNQTLFPLLLPYSLRMEGVWVKEVAETTWEGRPAWALLVPFAKGFFMSPVLTTTWRVVVAKDDASVLAVDFLPSVEYQEVQPMGMRYRILKYDEVNGARVPSQILAVGMNLAGQESGATRLTRVTPKIYGPWDPRLFVNPQRLEALEED
ncbi:MAG: hypothetical protein MUE90_11425 [Thermoanaerobaculales bacterium]|jgi:hypothetical protein|nr:hypothetical protein [Thermoanaerobaculales bacterium]